MNPSTTVIVSVYNKVNTIKDCIQSLLSINYPNKRILIIDGYSTDGSFEVLKNFENQTKLYQIRGNYSKALNWAIDKVDTEYIALTDADCVVKKDWLEKLVEPFEDNSEIVATAGYCGTSQNASLLQKIIGLELENRFKKFPTYIQRAPTMNLCIRTEIAKATRFDENIIVAIEVEFGYRLTNFGKILYVPEAKVIHYHRNSLWSYFKQQKNQVKWALKILFMHKEKVKRDPLNPPSMLIQIPLIYLIHLLLNQLG